MLNFDRITIKHALRNTQKIATSGFLAALECTKFVSGRVSAPDPAGGDYSAHPDPLASLRPFKGDPTSKGRERKGSEGRRGDGTPPNVNSWIRLWTLSSTQRNLASAPGNDLLEDTATSDRFDYQRTSSAEICLWK